MVQMVLPLVEETWALELMPLPLGLLPLEAQPLVLPLVLLVVPLVAWVLQAPSGAQRFPFVVLRQFEPGAQGLGDVFSVSEMEVKRIQ